MRNSALRVSFLSVCALLATNLCALRQAEASEVTISVLGLEPAAGASEVVASAVTEAIRQRASSSSGFRLIPGRDLVEVKLVFSCPDEAPACMSQAAQSIGATKLIFGNLQPVGTDAFLVTLKILDAEKGTVEAWTSEQITKAQAAPATLRGQAQKWFATLTGQALPGTIKVTGGLVGASVWIDGVQAGLMGQDGLTLAGITAGPHQVAVSKAGYEKWEHAITLGSGATDKLTVHLKAIEQPGTAETAGGEKPAAAPVTAPANEETPAREPPNQGSRIASWALLGVGMVAVGMGAYSSYKVSSTNSNLDPYRRYPCATGGAIACSADGKTNLGALNAQQIAYVQDQQNTGDTYTKLQWVGYGVGGALIATSAVFFYRGYFAKPSESAASDRGSHFVLLPAISPGSVGALALVSF